MYLEREDVSLGGGPGFGLDLVRYAYNHFVRDGETNYGWLPTQPRRCFEFCAGPAFIGFTLLGLGVCTSLALADVNPASVEAMQRTVSRNPSLSAESKSTIPMHWTTFRMKSLERGTSWFQTHLTS